MKNYRELKYQIYETITSPDDKNRASKIFDISIITLILVNLLLIIADTFDLPPAVHDVIYVFEVVSVGIFSVEYLFRLWTADLLYSHMKPTRARFRFAFSFLGLIDLLAVLPFYLPKVIPFGLFVLETMRIIRLLRFFKINRHTNTYYLIYDVFKKKARQLLASISIVFTLMVIVAVLMYDVEHVAQPDKFRNAFSSLWWALSTLTTIGFGDIYPVTIAGQILNGIFAFLSIGLIAVPTGIISAGFVEQSRRARHEAPDNYCPNCGHKIRK